MKNSTISIVSIVIIVVIIAGIAVAYGCGGFNRQLADLNYKFDHAIIHFADGDMEIEIKSWCDYDDSDMVQVTAVDGTVYYTHGANIILICNND